MRTGLLNLLLAAALTLALWRFWLSPGGTPQPPAPTPDGAASVEGSRAPAPGPAPGEAAREAPQGAPEEGAEGAEGAPRAGGYDVIVARDLFSAARGVVPPAPTPTAKPAPKAQPQPKLTLSGVVILDGEKSAFMHEGTQETKPRRLREGETFAGGTLKTIRPDGVTFLFGGSEISIPLRTPKETGPAPAVGGRVPPPIPQPSVPPRRPVGGAPAGSGPVDQTGLPRPVRQVPPGLGEEPALSEEEEALPDEYFEEDEEDFEEGLDEDGLMEEFDEDIPEDDEEPLE